MKINNRSVVTAALAVLIISGLVGGNTAMAAGPSAINLGTAGNYAILSKTGISTTGTTMVVGDMGVSPIAASAITGFSLILPSAGAFSTSALVTGNIYAPDYANPTPVSLTTAISDMETAYADGAGRSDYTATELGAGNIGGLTITPGLYKWGTGVLIPTNVTLSGSANDVWIFQIAQSLDVSAGVQIVLSGGAQASNVYWVVAGQTTVGTNAVFNGNILGQTAIVFNTGSTLNGRALAQTAVTLDATTVTKPSSGVVSPNPTTPTPTTTSTPTPATPVAPTQAATPTTTTTSTTNTTQTPYVTTTNTGAVNTQTSAEVAQKAALQAQLNGLMAQLVLIQSNTNIQANAQANLPSASMKGQMVKQIATNLTVGSRGGNVQTLQEFLISQNKGASAQALARAGATSYFGSITKAALAEFQASVGIYPTYGYFGSITRAHLNSNY